MLAGGVYPFRSHARLTMLVTQLENKLLSRIHGCTKIPVKVPKIRYYNHFIGHCGVFCGLKWRIQRAKIYFSPLPWTNQKQENNEASQSKLKTIQLFAPFSCWLAQAPFNLSRDTSICNCNCFYNIRTKWLKD